MKSHISNKPCLHLCIQIIEGDAIQCGHFTQMNIICKRRRNNAMINQTNRKHALSLFLSCSKQKTKNFVCCTAFHRYKTHVYFLHMTLNKHIFKYFILSFVTIFYLFISRILPQCVLCMLCGKKTKKNASAFRMRGTNEICEMVVIMTPKRKGQKSVCYVRWMLNN